MLTVRTLAELREQLSVAKGAGQRVGLVPTMGALHDGHLELIRRSVQDGNFTVVSLFVNPSQFNDSSDLDAYPRTEAQDGELASEAGANLLFTPEVGEVYPDGFCTEVRVCGGLTERLEGSHRGASHFHGVTTVVTKLLNMVTPDSAFFGAKDAQQVLVIKRLVRDLNMNIQIEVVETVREGDGLARSSRNTRLSASERELAAVVPRALDAAAALVQQGNRNVSELKQAATDVLLDAGLSPEYVAIVNPDTLADIPALSAPALLAVAVPVGPVRLIDNVELDPESQSRIPGVESFSPLPIELSQEG